MLQSSQKQCMGKIKKENIFKYFGEIIQPNPLHEDAN